MAEKDELTAAEESGGKGCIKGCVIALAVPLVLITALLAIVFYEPHYTHFGRHRTREMEETFGISVTEDIRLDEYIYISGWLCEDEEMLYISGIGDYRAFMENNVTGELVLRHENGIRYDYATHAESESEYVANVIKYEYTVHETEDLSSSVYVQFDEQDDGTYSAVFEKYT